MDENPHQSTERAEILHDGKSIAVEWREVPRVEFSVKGTLWGVFWIAMAAVAWSFDGAFRQPSLVRWGIVFLQAFTPTIAIFRLFGSEWGYWGTILAVVAGAYWIHLAG